MDCVIDPIPFEGFDLRSVEAGIPEEVVGRLLNHASKSITGQRYVRPNLTFMRSAMQIATEELKRRLKIDCSNFFSDPSAGT